MMGDLKTALLADITQQYDAFRLFILTLSDAQLTGPRDDAGWAPKDHIMHCAVWAGSMVAVINRQPRWEAMGLSDEIWSTVNTTYDVVNTVLHHMHLGKSPDEVRRAFVAAHRSVMDAIAPLTIADLERPYTYYQPWARTEPWPLHGYLLGSTADHYAEHQTYIAELLAG
jgi:hypothetical protein